MKYQQQGVAAKPTMCSSLPRKPYLESFGTNACANNQAHVSVIEYTASC